MFPVICKIGPFSVYSYGLMFAIAVIVCTFLLMRDAKKANINPEFVYDLMFYIVLSGILGARLFFIILNLGYFIANPLEVIMIQKGGLAFQGGFIAAIFCTLWYTKKRGFKITRILDLIAPYIALGHSLGRVGCFLNGCCYGRHADWGIFFPVHQDHLHPTQLYAAAGLFVIFLILKQYQKKSSIEGMVFITYIFLAATLRFCVEFFRADHYVTTLGLSIYQFVCIGLVLGALYVRSRLYRQGRKS